MKNDRIYEQSTGHSKSMKLDILNEIAKSICKINISQSQSTGFFIKFQKDQKTIYALVTAYHSLPIELYKKNTEIEIIPNIGNIKQIIKLDVRRRIFFLQDEDITTIEIYKEDNLIDNVKFLNYDKKCQIQNYDNYLDIDTFILHHPKGEDLECNSGKIIQVKSPKEFEFQHTLDTDEGSSGSPILLFDKDNEEPKVIGVHTSFINGNKNNIGTFINVLSKKVLKQDSNLTDYVGISKNSRIRIINAKNIMDYQNYSTYFEQK